MPDINERVTRVEERTDRHREMIDEMRDEQRQTIREVRDVVLTVRDVSETNNRTLGLLKLLATLATGAFSLWQSGTFEFLKKLLESAH